MDTWKNWSGDAGCRPAVFEAPASVEAVADAVRRAGDADSTVRVVGAGHSFGDVVCTDGTMISLDRLTGLLDVDADAGLVRVGAGTRLNDLNALLEAEGLALANLGDIDVQTVAGAISTGTHGTGRLLGNLATLVESLELVTADGSVLEVTADQADLLASARLSLGALGVVTAYTLRVVPSFNLHSLDRPMPMSEVLSDLDHHVDTNDHFEFFWFPFTDTALTRTNNRTDEAARPENRVRSYVQGTLIENTLLDLVSRFGRRSQHRIPQLNRAVTRMLPTSVRVDRSHRIFASTRSVRFTETEWAVPRAACRSMLADVRALLDRHNFPVNFPLEVRFVAADEESFLSPAYGRETAYIALHMYQGIPEQTFFAEAQRIAAAYDGRPHWGKRHGLDARTLSTLYPEWDRFQNVRTKLDPEGRFANAHVRRVFEAR